jgi:hypothetical protein
MARRQKGKSFGFFLAELFILVLGISASFMLNEYRIGQQERSQEQEMLINFRQNLVVDSTRLSSSIEVVEKQLEYATKVLRAERGVYSDSLFIHTISLLNYAPFSTNDITYEQMKSTGTAYLIQNKELLNQITGLYESGFDVVSLWSNIDGDHVRQRLIPYVEEHFPFVLGLNYPMSSQSTKRDFVKAVQSDNFLHLIQFGQSYKASAAFYYGEALSDIRTLLALLEAEIQEDSDSESAEELSVQ